MADLEAVHDPTVPIQSFQTMLPSSGSIANFWPASQNSVALPHELRKTISSQIGAIYVGFHLLLALINAARWHPKKEKNTANLEHWRPWVLDACVTLWNHFGRWTLNTNKRPLQNEAVSLYLQLLGAAACPQEVPEDFSPSSQKSTQILLDGVSSLLEMSNFSEDNQFLLASMLVRLQRALNNTSDPTSHITQRRNISTYVITENLGATIAQVCQNVEKFSGLQKDLQVRFKQYNDYQANAVQSALCLWTMPGSWPNHVAVLRKELCANASGSFTDPQLMKDAISVVKNFQNLNLDGNDDRPAKRRKTLPNPSQGGTDSIYEELMVHLNGSPPDSPVNHLVNLHSHIQYVL
jgi:serine/threonine-protein kinase ATR